MGGRADATLMVRLVMVMVTAVIATNWKEMCQSDREKCTTYCADYPQFCDYICQADSTIPGCPDAGEPTTPPPAACEPANCCLDETAECKACQADCEDPRRWCGKPENRNTPGCNDICCDQGCSDACEMKEVGLIPVTRTCKWRVRDQTHKAFRPVLLEANVEAACPFADNYGVHLESCRRCAAQHAPCADTYMACGGCCGTPWHDYFNLSVNTFHTCDEIKGYFKVKNSVQVECDEENEENAGTPEGAVTIVPVDPDVSDVVAEGELFSTCETPIKQLDCDQIPLKMKFECDECGEQGTPDLLNQCCDKCVAWAEGLETAPNANIPSNIKPFIYCSGCNVTKIKPLDPELAALPFMWYPWDGASRYAAYTEEMADKGVEEYIEEKVCSLLAPNCTAVEEEQPGFLAPTGKKCLPGEGGICAAFDTPEEVLKGGGGRRLAAEPVPTASFEMRGDNLFCPQMDVKNYKKSLDLPRNVTELPTVAEVLADNTEVFEAMIPAGNNVFDGGEETHTSEQADTASDGGETPPSGGETPPSGGETPPSGGETPPSGGETTPKFVEEPVSRAPSQSLMGMWLALSALVAVCPCCL